MILDAGNRQYEVVRDVFYGDINDVLVCKVLHSQLPEYKTVWRLKDRDITKNLLKDLSGDEGKKIYDDCFVFKDAMYFVFPYHKERSLEKFYLATVLNHSCDKRQIWMNLTVQCMTGGLPAGMLYLILTQGQVGLDADGAVYFNYFLDLAEYREDVGEGDCAMVCAGQILNLIRMEKEKAGIVKKLLERKFYRKAYTDFFQLYMDMKLVLNGQGKKAWGKIIKDRILFRKDLLYRILSVVSFTLLMIVMVMILFRFVWGEFSFFQLFEHTFEEIGTETLLQ